MEPWTFRSGVTKAAKMKLSFLILALIAAVAGSVGLAQTPAPPNSRITQQEFRALFDANNVIVIDTRAANAYRVGHIPGSLLLPLEGLASWAPQYQKMVESLKAAKKPIVAYCA